MAWMGERRGLLRVVSWSTRIRGVPEGKAERDKARQGELEIWDTGS